MIYIPFFIVILVSKRGVREAERGGKRERTVRTQNDTKNDTQRHRERDRAKKVSEHTLPSTPQQRCTTTPPPLHTRHNPPT